MDVDLEKLSTLDLLELGLDCSLGDTIDLLVAESVKQASDIRQAVGHLPTLERVGIYWHPGLQKVGMLSAGPLSTASFELLKEAVEQDAGLKVADKPLTRGHLADWWVKVAESSWVRNVGEVLQFLPSNYMPGAGGRPLASMVASGLLGAGLGYGGGWLAEKILPQEWKTPGQLARTTALMGGLGGAAVGAMPGLANWMMGRSFNDPSILAYGQGAPVSSNLNDAGAGAGPWSKPTLPPLINSTSGTNAGQFIPEAGPLSETYLGAANKVACAWAGNLEPEMVKAALGTIADSDTDLIRVDELGRVLWGSQNNPTTTMMTVSALHGASQMPDPRAQPGTVTPHQTGLLGLAMGAAGGGIQGYVVGYGVGKALAALTGMPPSTQQWVANTGLGLGVVNSVVPKLFGG